VSRSKIEPNTSLIEVKIVAGALTRSVRCCYGFGFSCGFRRRPYASSLVSCSVVGLGHTGSYWVNWVVSNLLSSLIRSRAKCQSPEYCICSPPLRFVSMFPVRYKLYILPTQCICVFRMVLTINSDCFRKQH
jgi:hypothetical protein